MPSTDTIAVIDFETTGMGPAQGARATEIAAVLVRDGQIVDRFQSLMKTDAWIPPFIEQLTGISNAMMQSGPPAEEVMRELDSFTRGIPMVAHNASFDRGFWLAERARAGLEPDPAHEFACTVLLSRRLYPEAPSHKLSALGEWCGLKRDGQAHRAMSDADVTAQLLIRLQRDITERFAQHMGPVAADHALLHELQKANKAHLEKCVAQHMAKRQARLALEPAADLIVRPPLQCP